MNTKERLMEIVEMSGSLTAVEVYDFFCMVLDEKDRKIAELEKWIQKLETRS